MRAKIGDLVQPTKAFYHRPICRVINAGDDKVRGKWFLAEYPDGRAYRQFDYEDGHNRRFEPVEEHE